jgi:hypothetical protein
VIRWLKKKISESNQWRANNEKSWAGFDTPNGDGVTRFQEELLSQLQDNPGVTTVEFVVGKSKNFYRGTLSPTGAEFFIYEDEAEIGDFYRERWAFDTREQLVDLLLTFARNTLNYSGPTVFVFANDDKTLSVYGTESEAVSACEGIDVAEGNYLFFDAKGFELTSVFDKPNRIGKIFTTSGSYHLTKAEDGTLLADLLPVVSAVEGKYPIESIADIWKLVRS